MATGPGKYDDACTEAREATDADAIVLIVVGGEHGSGVSVQCADPAIIAGLPALLRVLAAEIEQGIAGG